MTWRTVLTLVWCTVLTGCVVGDRGRAPQIVGAIEEAGASGDVLDLAAVVDGGREDAVSTVERTEAADGHVSYDLHLA